MENILSSVTTFSHTSFIFGNTVHPSEWKILHLSGRKRKTERDVHVNSFVLKALSCPQHARDTILPKIYQYLSVQSIPVSCLQAPLMRTTSICPLRLTVLKSETQFSRRWLTLDYTPHYQFSIDSLVLKLIRRSETFFAFIVPHLKFTKNPRACQWCSLGQIAILGVWLSFI